LLTGFSALQRAENSSILDQQPVALYEVKFQCSSASRKFLNSIMSRRFASGFVVSVLFSEPKIPQSETARRCRRRCSRFQCSSASRKFLNYPKITASAACTSEFQCSSASRKFLNLARTLQRLVLNEFQCSSASRKFLNQRSPNPRACEARGFSALQRAENSSRKPISAFPARPARVSVLFSEPKIPQSSDAASGPKYVRPVSVLFSEPKIPQSPTRVERPARPRRFQCSSASRKFLNLSNRITSATNTLSEFQCSSASRKFLNR